MESGILYTKTRDYITRVIEGEEIVPWEVKKQCEKLEEEFEVKQHKEDYPYYFDFDKLKIIENLLKLLRFATGFVANQPVLPNLSDYQCFLICNIFGWRYKDRPYKFKHNDITLYVSRKNAKVLAL